MPVQHGHVQLNQCAGHFQCEKICDQTNAGWSWKNKNRSIQPNQHVTQTFPITKWVYCQIV